MNERNFQVEDLHFTMYGIKSIHAMTFYVSIDQEAVLVKGKEKQMSVKKSSRQLFSGEFFAYSNECKIRIT